MKVILAITHGHWVYLLFWIKWLLEWNNLPLAKLFVAENLNITLITYSWRWQKFIAVKFVIDKKKSINYLDIISFIDKKHAKTKMVFHNKVKISKFSIKKYKI